MGNLGIAIDAVLAGGSVALTFGYVCIDMPESLFLDVSFEHRLRLSLTTRLKPSWQRPFRLQLLDETKSRQLRLSSQNLSVVSIKERAVTERV